MYYSCRRVHSPPLLRPSVCHWLRQCNCRIKPSQHSIFIRRSHQTALAEPVARGGKARTSLIPVGSMKKHWPSQWHE